MVIGLLLLTAIPTVTGVAQALSAQKNQEQREKDARRMAKFHIDVKCNSTANNAPANEMNDGRIVLKDGCLWIGPAEIRHEGDYGYVAEAFYIEYPDKERDPPLMGLVSQVRDDPPLLNWIYIDKDTMELKYGNRSTSITHHIGPWDWTDDEIQIVFDDEDVAYVNAFYAVQQAPIRGNGKWQLYFDMKGNGLSKYVPTGSKKVQVQLHRTMIKNEMQA